MLKIGTTTVHEPAFGGVSITDEPIWGSNTGRASDGKMVGDIVAWKKTVTVTWPPLSFSDSQTLRNAIVNAGAFFKLTYNDFSSSQTVETTVYCGNIPRAIYSLAQGLQRHTGVTIKFVEQ